MTYKSPAKNHKTAILILFFLTGLTGLAYELVWIRLLILVFGSTQFAVTTVLTTFMAGLALGSLLFGRYIDKSSISPLKLYGLIEIGIGIYCLLSPFIFDALREVYLRGFFNEDTLQAGFDPAQFLLSFLGIIIPTTLMGGTLPIIVKYLADYKEKVGRHTAVAYSLNTLGAVAGCMLTGLFFLYFLGVKSTLYAAGIVDLIIGVLLIAVFAKAYLPKASEEPIETAISEGTLSSRTTTIVLAAFALSGFASLVYEVLWTRVLSLIIGSSVYAFTVMLATFLLGIGIGSIVFAPFIDKAKKPLLWFAGLEAVIGFSSLISIFLYRKLPFIFFNMQKENAEQFYLFLFLQFILCSALMIVPTLAMGAIFPLVGKIYTNRIEHVGRSIGNVYFFNTAGSIFGSFLGGFLLMPVLGVQKAVILTALLNIVIAIVLLAQTTVKNNIKIVLSIAAIIVFIVSAALMPPWDRLVMTLGLYSNVYEEKSMAGFKEGAFAEKLTYYKEGINAIITVRQGGPGGENVSYQANGKMEARARGAKPAETWSLLGHIPMLMYDGKRGGAKDALLVGLGSGITLGAMTEYPLTDIDVIELEPAVKEAAGFFKASNNNSLEDPRVDLYITDGRNFVFTAEKKYDVIVSAVSDPWITGVSNLFTQEYFSKTKEILADDGIMALWFQNYRIRPEELRVGLGTFASVFPEVSVWFHYTNASDLIVIGSKKRHAMDFDALEGWFRDKAVAKDLRRIGINTPYDILNLFLIGNKDIRRYIGESRLNTDERPILEFTLPKLLYMDPKESVKLIHTLLNETLEIVPPVEFPSEWTDKEKSEFYFKLGKTFNQSSFRIEQALAIFEKAVKLNPANEKAKQYIKALKKELKRSP
ncbi:MAG: fused MFS/spermidine synthase [Thermodesulfobacteriota bacterium]